MVEKPSGTGQWKKLFFNKHFSDTQGVSWKPSTWKVVAWLMFILAILIVLYSFFVENQADFFQEVVFYAIITVIVIAIVWVVVGLFSKSRKIFTGFMLAWILILGLYMFLGFIFSIANIMEFHYGFTTWTVITFLSLLGAKRIDGSLDKNDVGYGLLVLLIIIIGNVPIFENGGFLAQLDSVLTFIAERLNFINIKDLAAK